MGFGEEKNRKKEEFFMETEKIDILKSKSLKEFIKGSFVIIGLFVVLYCCIDMFVIFFGKNFEYNIITLYIILGSPIIVFFIVLFWFFYFINKMTYWFTGNKSDDITFNMKNINEFIKTLKDLNPNSFKKNDTLKERLQNLLIESFGGFIKNKFLKGEKEG